MKTNSLDFDAQALREKILDLAMRGKLIKQDPNDEPASVLLEKIKAEKAKLVKEKKIKKSKPLPEITDDEKPFDIPDSWEWVHVKDVTTIGNFHSVSPQNINQGENLIELADIESNTGRLLNFEKVTSEVGSNKYQYNQGDVLFAKLRPYLRKVLIAPNDGICTTELLPINGIQTSNIYIYYTFLSSLIFEQIRQEMHGVNLPRISPKKLAELIIPLPPLSEQSRIAAKIAQLFALLRKVETSTQQYTKLQTLLKSKVLDLAMRGKLVEQDPHDEPASVLLKKIKAEKEQLIKEGKMKKSKPLPPITDDEKPFDIPNSWEWVRLGDVITILRGGSPRPIKKYLTNNSSGINWIKIGDSKPNSKYIESATEKIIPEGLNKTREVHKGDFLLSNSMSFGRPYILKINGAVHDGWLVLSEYEQLFDKDYLYYLLSSSFINKQFVALATGSTVKNLNRERVANTIAVVPPLLEQKRIAVIIERLSPLLSGVEISL